MAVFTSFYFNFAFAHIFPDTPGAQSHETGKYTLAFLPVPAYVEPNKTTILNLNIQENGTDTRSVVASVEIKDKESGKVIREVPSRPYEIADVYLTQNFSETGDYIVRLTANINGDPQYNKVPIVADFELSVRNPVDITLVIVQSVVIILVIIGMLLVVRYLRKRAEKQNKVS